MEKEKARCEERRNVPSAILTFPLFETLFPPNASAAVREKIAGSP